MAVNRINAVFKGGMNFTADVNGHKIEIDTDEAGGGKNLGTRPKVLMLVSLAGCTGLDVVSILNKMRVNFSDFSISVDGHLTDTEPKMYDEVVINYTIKVKKEDESKVEKAVNLSEEKYCGVSKMFEAFAKVSFKINYL
ncbi:MAG TPA: OsmC family protein [Hanamia sp.]|nr:OsmC family protein [Hanamia sp.]